MSNSSLRIILTGATGMVGEGVLHVCLQHPAVEAVLIVNRRESGIRHEKLTEVIHDDFFNLLPIESKLAGYNTCLFCLGVSSVGMNEPDYFRMTHTLTLNFAAVLNKLNPHMTFCYISGAGTDSSEKGRSMWARVKGKTENDLHRIGFEQSYSFRPGFIKPMPGMKRTLKFYRYISWLFPLGRRFAPAAFCKLEELANAMINASLLGYQKNIVEGKDIISLGKLQQRK